MSVLPFHHLHSATTGPTGLGRARSRYPYTARQPDELSFDRGVELIILSMEEADPDWWRGQLPDGTEGIFPANYVRVEGAVWPWAVACSPPSDFRLVNSTDEFSSPFTCQPLSFRCKNFDRISPSFLLCCVNFLPQCLRRLFLFFFFSYSSASRISMRVSSTVCFLKKSLGTGSCSLMVVDFVFCLSKTVFCHV